MLLINSFALDLHRKQIVNIVLDKYFTTYSDLGSFLSKCCCSRLSL